MSLDSLYVILIIIIYVINIKQQTVDVWCTVPAKYTKHNGSVVVELKSDSDACCGHAHLYL